MYKNIVVGYDGTERAMTAVEQAADLATALGSRLHLVTALKKDEIHRVGESTDERYMSRVEIAQDNLARVASKFNHLDFRASAAVGAPAKVLVDEAERVDADLILTEKLFPDGDENLFRRSARGDVLCPAAPDVGSERTRRESFAVDFQVWSQREGVERYQRGRDHVLRQLFAQSVLEPALESRAFR